MAYFDSEWKYLDNCVTIQAQIAAIDLIIAQLIITAAKAASKENITEYWLDDGQTKIKTIYRSEKQIADGIRQWRKLKFELQNGLTGRMVRLVDSKNFPNNGNGFF